MPEASGAQAAAAGAPAGVSQAPAVAPVPQAGPAQEKKEEQKQGAERQERRELKPIPEKKEAGPKRPALPGVVTARGDDIPELHPVRGADGRFVSREDKEAAFEAEMRAEKDADDGIAPAEKKDGGEDGKAPAPEAGKDGKPPLPEGQKPADGIEFGGKKYKTEGEALQAARSLHGMFRSLNTEKQRLTEERNYGYQSGNAWKAEHDRVKAELDALKQGKPAPAVQGAQVGAGVAGSGEVATDQLPDTNALLSDIDMDAFEAIAVQGGLPKAGQYLASELLRVVTQKILPVYDNRLKTSLQPFQAERDQVRQAQEVDQLINSLSGLRTAAGEVAFPELSDHKALAEIGDFWRASGLPREAAMTHQGLMAAIGLYRMSRGFIPAEGAPNLNPPGAPAAAVELPASGPAASVPAESVGPTPANAGRSNHSPQTQRLLNALDKTNLVDPKLGFARRPASR